MESAKGHAQLLEKYDFTDICISMKASSVPLTVAAYRLAAEVFSLSPAPGRHRDRHRVERHHPVRRGHRRPALRGHRQYHESLPHRRPGAGGQRRHRHSEGGGTAPRRGEIRLLPHLRQDGDRPDKPGRPGGTAGEGHAQGHHRGGDGLRGQRPR